MKLGGWEGYVDVAGFWSEYFDMMEFVFASFDRGFMSLNIGDTRIAGVEFSIAGRSQVGQIPVNVLAGYTYIDPVFQEFTEDDRLRSSVDYNILKYRSKHVLKLDIESSYNDFTLGLVTNYVSHMEAIDAIFDLVIPGLRDFRAGHNTGYTLFNARISYDFRNYQISILGNNLLNQEYAARPGLLNDPISITLKFGAKF